MIGGWCENEQNTRKRTFETKLKSFETYGMTETITHIAAKQVGSVLFSFTQYQITTDDRNCLVIDARFQMSKFALTIL
jgi:O-succinylbenzoic acid--CoA ligase